MSLIAKLEKQIAAGAKSLIVEEVDLPALARELDAIPVPAFALSEKAGVLGLFNGLPLIAEAVALPPADPLDEEVAEEAAPKAAAKRKRLDGAPSLEPAFTGLAGLNIKSE